MLKDIKILSDQSNGKAMITASQEEWTTFLQSLSLVMIKAIMEPQSLVVKIIFLHEQKKFRVELERASESAIILP